MRNRNRFTGKGRGSHGLLNALMSCGSIGELRGLAPLPKDSQELIDKAVVNVGLDRLAIVSRLLAAGLRFDLPDPMSVMELYWERESKAGYAKRTMMPGARGERQLTDRLGTRVPIYATIDDFSLNIRVLRASERAGVPLDTSNVSQATRRVHEAVEDASINGAGIVVAGNDTPGLLTAPNANSIAYTGNEAWTHINHTGDDILVDVLAMIDELQEDRMFGPYELFIPTTYGNKLNQDFKANGSLTIRQRLEEIDTGGGRKLSITVADQLPTDRTIMVQMTDDVVDVIVGQEPIPISWQDGPQWEFYFAVLAFMIPRVKTTYDDQSGICLGYTS